MGVAYTCLVYLGALNYNTVGSSFNNMEIKVGVSLGGGRKTAVSLGVCHGSVNGKVILLNVCKELFKVFKI